MRVIEIIWTIFLIILAIAFDTNELDNLLGESYE